MKISKLPIVLIILLILVWLLSSCNYKDTNYVEKTQREISLENVKSYLNNK